MKSSNTCTATVDGELCGGELPCGAHPWAKAEAAETPRERLFALHRDMTAAALKLMKQKNGSYGKAEDPLFNFRRHGLKGFVVRMDDKMSRLDNFIENGQIMTTPDETLVDTLQDLINYAVLFLFWVQENKK